MDRGCNAETDQEEGVDGRAPEVDGTSTEIRGEDPGKHDEDHLEGRGDETQGEGSLIRHAGLCAGISTYDHLEQQ